VRSVNRESTVSVAGKLDVTSRRKKGERIIDICCNITFARINTRMFRDNADRITEGAMSGTKTLDCVA
jgi:hypothetical protein